MTLSKMQVKELWIKDIESFSMNFNRGAAAAIAVISRFLVAPKVGKSLFSLLRLQCRESV